jgi:hypothetical protein
MADYFTKKDAEEFKEDIKRYMDIFAKNCMQMIDIAIKKINDSEDRFAAKSEYSDTSLTKKI